MVSLLFPIQEGPYFTSRVIPIEVSSLTYKVYSTHSSTQSRLQFLGLRPLILAEIIKIGFHCHCLQNSTYFKTGCSIVFSIHSCVDCHESVFAELQDFALGCCSSQRFSEQVKEPLVSPNRWENIFLAAQMNRISVYKRSSVAHSQSHRFFLV